MDKEIAFNTWEFFYMISLVVLGSWYFGFFLRDLFEKKNKP